MSISQTIETNQAVAPIEHCGSSIFLLNMPKIKSFFEFFIFYIYFFFAIRIIFNKKVLLSIIISYDP